MTRITSLLFVLIAFSFAAFSQENSLTSAAGIVEVALGFDSLTVVTTSQTNSSLMQVKNTVTCNPPQSKAVTAGLAKAFRPKVTNEIDGVLYVEGKKRRVVTINGVPVTVTQNIEVIIPENVQTVREVNKNL